MSDTRTISICIPVYNEAQNLPVAVDAVETLFANELSGYELEIVVTDNCSTDDTWPTVQRLASQKPHLRGYRFSRNFGYQNSVFAGLFLATGDAVIELDADLEDPPDVIPRFIEKWEEGFKVAYGVRASRHGPLLLRMAFRAFYALLDSVSELPLPAEAGDFRLLDRQVVDVLKQLPERHLYLRGLVVYLGFPQAEVRYHRNPRMAGESKFRLFHYVMLALDAVTAFSRAPLRLVFLMGLALFAGSMTMAAYYLVGHLAYGTPVQGFTTLVVLMLFLHSVTFIFMGVLGEYLGRIYDDAKARPRIIIAESTDGEGPAVL